MKIVKITISFLLVLTGIAVWGQTGINSPYSRFGLGELHNNNINSTVMGMGGISIGFANSTTLNPSNPASYVVQDSSAFMFEIGIYGNSTTYKTTTMSEHGSDLSLNYLMFGFPVTRWYRMALGVLPFSKVGYNIQTTVEVPNFSDVLHNFTGDGGLNQIFWGHGFKLQENLRIGFNATYLFGQTSRSSMIYFPDSAYIFGTKSESRLKVSDFIFDYGLQYDLISDQNRKATIGVTYANTFNINAKRDYLSKTLLGGYNDVVEYVIDTIVYRSDEKGTLVLPQRIGIGVTYQKIDHWLVGIDFEWQNWKKYKAFGVSDSLTNAWRVAVGGELQPKHSSISSLYKRMTYRLGARYNHSYLNLYGNQINEFGISFGLGFPIKKSKTGIDLSVEIGRRGTTNNQLIQENFINLSLGISIQEIWFYKKQYH
ncbi:MAG: hypothetical protein CVT99_14840 [Bacteroidetes bacterium HGW-Bacteroidetes-16]|jgi:hypothetical protein|nr:MAG: hypothetical protein CVT99_14840 [Bacteroidetes bacterium HGW-Bacteroidetes-16]